MSVNVLFCVIFHINYRWNITHLEINQPISFYHIRYFT